MVVQLFFDKSGTMLLEARELLSMGFPVAAAMTLRVSLEAHVRYLVRQHGISHHGYKLKSKLSKLLAAGAITETQVRQLKKVLEIGNSAAHAWRVEPEDAQQALESLDAILEGGAA